MSKEFMALCDSLEDAIKTSYESAITMDEAEKLASKFLYAQLQVAQKLQVSDLDTRMKKSGVKAVKAAVYLDAATKNEKKPSDVMLGAMVDTDAIVLSEQNRLDSAEAERDKLQNYYNIFKEAHIHYRGIAKGRFE